MRIIIGSARCDERGIYSGGAAGDQKQPSNTGDYTGEVSMQDFYEHRKGWIILRPKSIEHAKKIAANMKIACNNSNLGYDQNNRLGVIKYGINTETKTECDCSSLVRECVKDATGTDPGNFTTDTEVANLVNTRLFETPVPYISGTKLYDGDILVTKVKGHTAIVVDGYKREETVADGKSTLNKTEKWIGLVIPYFLNVRTWAGVDNDKCSFGPLARNMMVSVCDMVEDSNGTPWYYIDYHGKYGFVNSNYIKKV